MNVPKSHIIGFEFSGIWQPIQGLTVTPAVSYAHSRIGGDFSTFNYLGALQNVNGERLPGTPEWQADIDGQYEWKLSDAWSAYVGGNVNYQGSFNSNFGDFSVLHVDDYVLLDLRAGVEHENWRLQVWGPQRDGQVLREQQGARGRRLRPLRRPAGHLRRDAQLSFSSDLGRSRPWRPGATLR